MDDARDRDGVAHCCSACGSVCDWDDGATDGSWKGCTLVCCCVAGAGSGASGGEFEAASSIAHLCCFQKRTRAQAWCSGQGRVIRLNWNFPWKCASEMPAVTSQFGDMALCQSLAVDDSMSQCRVGANAECEVRWQ